MQRDDTIFIAGARTAIGVALRREMDRRGFLRRVGEQEEEPDLLNEQEVEDFFQAFKPEYVFWAGGTSGGIQANQRFPADLMRENLLSQTHVLHAAHRSGVKKLLYLGSSCSYPKHCPQPMRVDDLMAGAPESTNEAYAMAKRAGVILCRAYRQQHGSRFIIGIPGDVYGPDDHFDLENAHVIPALIRKMQTAKDRGSPSVEVWGSGNPRREFMYADDLASACVFVMERYDGQEAINLGVGETRSIREIAEAIRTTVGFGGFLVFNQEKPDGMPVKGLDSSRLFAMGWRPSVSLLEGLRLTYKGYLRTLTTQAVLT